MKRSLKIAPWLVLLPLILVVYQNCGQAPQRSAEASYVVKIDAPTPTGDAPATVPLSQLSKAELVATCEDTTKWECTILDYSPGAKGDGEIEKICITINGVEQCLEARRFGRDTTHALSACTDCDANASLPGGRYNYQDVQCYHSQIMNGAAFPVSNEAATAQVALAGGLRSCLNLVEAQ